ncbi:MAG: GNAT family N-acetyltransferase [Alistipes sp.]|jgi:ribosomal protein S18 acetylase RimI-like enzyme|nr:GNAT family N-acetyltransferase [Alistipes sp.]
MNFKKATTDDCELICSIAAEIWAPTYSNLMSKRQLDYMFEMMYSPDNLRKAMTEGGQNFMIFSLENAENVGYVAYEILPENDFYLQKIYLKTALQGSGRGKMMLEGLLEHLKTVNPAARRLGLNVNRQNIKAVCFYLRNGFEIVSRRDHPIGEGFFMNDYVLEREI